MADLILRPSTLVDGKPWALQLRYHESVGPTEYHTITRVSDEMAMALPPDVLALVIAAREFWDIHNDLSQESRALDKALEAFAERVPYENEPDDPTGTKGQADE